MKKINFKTIIFDVVSACDNDCMVCLVEKNKTNMSLENIQRISDFLSANDFSKVNDIIFGQGDVFKLDNERFEILLGIKNTTIREITFNTTFSEKFEFEKYEKLELLKENVVDDETGERVTRKVKINYVFNPMLEYSKNLSSLQDIISYSQNVDKVSLQFLISSNLLRQIGIPEYEIMLDSLVRFLEGSEVGYYGILFNLQANTFSRIEDLNSAFDFIKRVRTKYECSDYRIYNINDLFQMDANLASYGPATVKNMPQSVLIDRDLDVVQTLELFNEKTLNKRVSVSLDAGLEEHFMKYLFRASHRNFAAILKNEKCRGCRYVDFCAVFDFSNERHCSVILDNIFRDGRA